MNGVNTLQLRYGCNPHQRYAAVEPLDPTRACGGFSSSSTRTCQQALARELKGRDGLFASNGRELLEKLVQGIAALDVVEERLHSHTGSDEHGRPAESLRVAVHDSGFVGHD